MYKLFIYWRWITFISTTNFCPRNGGPGLKKNLEFAILVEILCDLDRYYTYELEYSLFLHANCDDKKLDYYITFVRPFETNEGLSYESMLKNVEYQKFMHENFKYHGYHVFKSDYIDFIYFNFLSRIFVDRLYKFYIYRINAVWPLGRLKL